MTTPRIATDYVPGGAYGREDWDEVSDTPALTDAELAELRPDGGGLPPALAAALKGRGGRPKAEIRKVSVTIRLDPQIIAAFKRTGDGWQTRMNAALAEAARKLPL